MAADARRFCLPRRVSAARHLALLPPRRSRRRRTIFRFGQREADVLARFVAAAGGDDAVLLAVDRVRHLRAALRSLHVHGADNTGPILYLLTISIACLCSSGVKSMMSDSRTPLRL